MAAHDLSKAPPNAVTHNRATECLLDAEAETAQGQAIGAEE